MGNATLRNFPDMHFSRWGSLSAAQAAPPARRNSLVANSEISVASDDDEAPPPAVPPAASALFTETSPISNAARRQPSNDAIIDVALRESAS